MLRSCLTALLLFTSAAHADDKPSIDSTSISGTCQFKGSWCPGARALLKDKKGRVLQQAMLTREGFKFGGLTEKTYDVIFEYPKYKLSSINHDTPVGGTLNVNFDQQSGGD